MAKKLFGPERMAKKPEIKAVPEAINKGFDSTEDKSKYEQDPSEL